MKKISDDKLNKLALFTLIIMVLFMSIISMELIVIVYTEKINTEAISDWTTTKKTSKQYVRFLLGFIVLLLFWILTIMGIQSNEILNFKILVIFINNLFDLWINL